MDSRLKRWFFLPRPSSTAVYRKRWVRACSSLGPRSLVFCIINFWISCWSDSSPLQCLLAGLKRINLWSVVVPRPCWNFPVALQHMFSSAHAKWNPGCRCPSVTGCSVLRWWHTAALLSFQPYPAWKQTGECWRPEKEEGAFSPALTLSSASLGWQQVSQWFPAKASQLAVLMTWTLKRLLFSTSCLPSNRFLAQLETQMLSFSPTLEISFQEN